VQAIHQAAVQVLLAGGKEKLTTTRVAQRAGVSVGTLYQYYPNKSSLLQAVLRAHLDRVFGAVVSACDEAKGRSLAEMTDCLITGFLFIKMQHVETSRALYFISDDIGGVEIAREHSVRGINAIAAMFSSSPERLLEDPHIVATTLMAAITGVGRRMIESGCLSPKTMQAMRHELGVLARAYVQARIA
jgi:AcrR family transcriptional regulator